MARKSASIFAPEIVRGAVRDSFPKLDPRNQLKNPVMFIVELGSVITTAIFILDLARGRNGQLWFVGVIAVWLWLTVLFANFAEAIAEGRGKAQANALRATRTTTNALRRARDGHLEEVPAPELQKGDVVVVVRVARSASACALPRPSAIASAKLANRTVSHSQNAITPTNHSWPCCPRARSRTKMIVVMMLPSSTMNITGFLSCIRGSSFGKESRTAAPTRSRENIEPR